MLRADDRERRHARPLAAAVTVLAVIASFATVYALCRRFAIDTQPAIVAAIVAMSLSRREPKRHAIHPVAFPLVVAALAPVSAAVGWLLRTAPIAGAMAFVAGLFLSVWLRNFGTRAQAIGALVALPLIAILAVPPPRDVGHGGPLVYLAIVESASLIAFAYAVAARRLFARFLTPPSEVDPPERSRASGIGPSPQTRMAIQMAVAVAAAFAAGFALFPGHWGWTVLTAFIVCSGARGRGDAAYKGVLRLAGALGGTLLAAGVARLAIPNGPPEAAAIFAMLFVGLWLRDVNYAYWACCITLILSLLAAGRPGDDAEASAHLLAFRLEAILVGAICAVASCWFVLPIRTTSVVRRRLADALRALDDLVVAGHDGEERPTRLATYEHRMRELHGIAVPLRFHRRIVANREREDHPATWIDIAHGVHGDVLRTNDIGGTRIRTVRRAIGDSRRAVAAHGAKEPNVAIPSISSALQKLRDALAYDGG